MLVIGGAVLAHVLSERIGTSIIRVGGGWFADLLDALADWWDDLGPGGQGLVLLGGLSLLALGLLFPTTVVLAGAGAIATTTTVPTLVVAGAGVTSIALLAQAASAGGGGSGSGGRPTPGGDSPSAPPRRTVHAILTSLRRGRRGHVKVVDSDTALQAVYDELTSGAAPFSRPGYPGSWVRRPDGIEIGLRSTSRTGGRTIDILDVDGTRTVVHIE